MVINYQDKNMIITYLQIFLLEYLGLTVHQVIPRSKKEASYYEITSNDPLIVTGYYNLQTYSALALYMAYNYPNEGYPIKWSKSAVKGWVSEDYVYQGDQKELLEVISTNMDYATENREVVKVPERILSYIFNEVATPQSSPEEVLRVRQLLSENIYENEYNHVLDYTESLYNTIIDIQKNVINKYTTKYSTEEEIIIMDYKKDNQGYYVDESGNRIPADSPKRVPVTSYLIGKQLSNVDTQTTQLITDYEKISNKAVRINLITDRIDFAEVNGEEVSSWVKINDHQWLLNLVSNVETVSEIKVTYQEPFEYNIITGYITFSQFKENKEITVIKTINEEVSLPLQFDKFKVTGYVDPWTEILIKGEYEDGD